MKTSRTILCIIMCIVCLPIFSQTHEKTSNEKLYMLVDETVNMIQRSTDKRETTFRRINVLSEKVTSLTESELTVNAVPVNNFLNTIENLLDELNELKIKSEDIFNYVVATKDMFKRPGFVPRQKSIEDSVFYAVMYLAQIDKIWDDMIEACNLLEKELEC